MPEAHVTVTPHFKGELVIHRDSRVTHTWAMDTEGLTVTIRHDDVVIQRFSYKINRRQVKGVALWLLHQLNDTQPVGSAAERSLLNNDTKSSIPTEPST